jgi:hypothetical protein
MTNRLSFSYISTGPDVFPPIPAKKSLPDWYKNLEDYIGGKKDLEVDGKLKQTGKRCIPMFDAMSFGYLLRLPADLFVKRNEDGSCEFGWPSADLITFHSKEQMATLNKGMPPSNIPKVSNPYSIQTPKGYSTFFCPPVNHENDIIIFTGVVDTDDYVSLINFPFLIREGFEGIIPAGTPYAQVIPFKREKWKMDFEQNEARYTMIERVFKTVVTRFQNGYRKNYWQRKSFD